MKVQILGTGCARCKRLEENAKTAATELGIACEFEKVTDIQQIVAFGVITTPALVIDGAVKTAGQLLSPDQIKPLLQGK